MPEYSMPSVPLVPKGHIRNQWAAECGGWEQRESLGQVPVTKVTPFYPLPALLLCLELGVAEAELTR